MKTLKVDITKINIKGVWCEVQSLANDWIHKVAVESFGDDVYMLDTLEITITDDDYYSAYNNIIYVSSYKIVTVGKRNKGEKPVNRMFTVSAASTESSSKTTAKDTAKPNISQKHKMITFGYQVFEATSGKVYTPNGLEMEWGKETETQGIVGQKPISYVKSISLIKANFRINSSRYLGSDPEAVRAAWSEMAENNMTYGFMIGNEYVGTRFIVKSVRMTNTRYNGSGKLISATFDISVEEYAGENYKLSVLQEPSEYS